ncbi:MAG: ABC transporter substrate-binding protein [Candidatus Aminicenantes bacterium]|nr:ABC transporter substrate-binding protein [Candidatus Aminicenantes bacterium]
MNLLRRGLCALVFLPLFLPAAEPRVLRLGCFDFPSVLNPVYATSETAQAVMNKIHQALFYFDPAGEIRPELVADWQWDEGRLEISLTLKKGVRFANGAALRSQDVAATIELLKNPIYEYPYLSDLAFIEKIAVVDPWRMRIKLKEKFAPWKNYLTFKILSADDIGGCAPGAFRSRLPMGCGPFQIEKVNEPRAIVLKENPYYGNRGSFTHVVYSVLRDPQQGPLKLLNDELDAVDVQSDDVQSYHQLPEWRERFRLVRYKKFGYTYLVFNLKNPLIDLNFRRLFYNRLLASPFLDAFLKGAGEKVFSPFLYLSDSVRARPLPAAAPSQRRHLRILANSESTLRTQLVLFLCEEMKAFNVELEPVFVEYQTFLKYLKQGNFDLAVSAFLLDMDWNLKDILSSSGYFNYAGFVDAQMDALLESGLREMDEKKRRLIYLDAHERWLASLPFIPLFNLNYFMGVSKLLKIPAGRFQTIGSTGDFFYTLQDW